MVCTCYIYDIVEFFIKKIIQHYYATKKKQTKQNKQTKKIETKSAIIILLDTARN